MSPCWAPRPLTTWLPRGPILGPQLRPTCPYRGTEEFAKRVRRQGIKSVASYPRQEHGCINDKKVKGGAAAIWQRHANVKPVQEVVGARWAFEAEDYFMDFSAVVLRTGVGQVLYKAGYLDVHLGLAGANITLLSKWAAIIELAGLPFVVAADWDVEPQELIDSR